MASVQSFEFIPYLSIRNASAAVEFYSTVFGVEPYMCLDMPDGRLMHCEYRVGNARFYLSEELPEHGGTPCPQSLGATTVAIHLYVDNCDAIVKKMADNGATILMEPVDMFWGERFARVRDPYGHEWGVATKLQTMTPEEIQKAATKLFAEMDEQS